MNFKDQVKELIVLTEECGDDKKKKKKLYATAVKVPVKNAKGEVVGEKIDSRATVKEIQAKRGVDPTRASLATKRLARSMQNKGATVTDDEPIKVDGKKAKLPKTNDAEPSFTPKGHAKVMNQPTVSTTGKPINTPKNADYISQNFATDDEVVADANKYADNIVKSLGFKLNGKEWESLHRKYIKASENAITLKKLKREYQMQLKSIKESAEDIDANTLEASVEKYEAGRISLGELVDIVAKNCKSNDEKVIMGKVKSLLKK